MNKSIQKYVHYFNLKKIKKISKYHSSIRGADPTFSPLGKPGDYENQIKLLEFSHPVFVTTPQILSNFEEVRSLRSPEQVDAYHIHSFIYQSVFGDDQKFVVKKKWLHPTLSIRTVRLDPFHSIKFGLPMRLGMVMRWLNRKEIMYGLLISDYVDSVSSKISNLSFEMDMRGIVSDKDPHCGVLYRKASVNTDNFVPTAFIFSTLNKIQRRMKTKDYLELTMHVLKTTISDVLLMIEQFQACKMMLELHGQNLSIHLNEDHAFVSEYLYRDMGNSCVDLKVLKKTGFMDHYQKSYSFDPSLHPEHARRMKWRIFWAFVYGTLLYTAQDTLKKRKIRMDVYEWFKSSGLQKKCESILIYQP